MTHLTDDLRQLVHEKRKLEILSRRKKKQEEKVAKLERACYDRMEGEGFKDDDHVKVGGVLHMARRTTYAVVQNQAKLEQWMRDTDQEALFEMKPRKKELNRIARSHLDNKQPLPPGLGYYDKTYISTRGITAQEDKDGDEG